MLHQTFLFLGQLWQLFEVSQILEFYGMTSKRYTWIGSMENLNVFKWERLKNSCWEDG